jgi:hypothetical protein
LAHRRRRSANGIRVGGVGVASVDLEGGMRLEFGDVVVECLLTDAVDGSPRDASVGVAPDADVDRRFDEVARLMRRLASCVDEDVFLAETVDAAVRLVGAERGFVITKTKGGMEVRAVRNLAAEDRRGPNSTSRGASRCVRESRATRSCSSMRPTTERSRPRRASRR